MRPFLAVLLVATACARPAPPAVPAQEVDGTTAHRIVRAAVLRDADLPGYTRDTDEASRAGRVGSCLTQGAAPITDRSTAFDRGGVQIVSGAAVARTLAAVREEEAFMRDEFPQCFERFLTFVFAQADLTVTKYRSTPFRVRVPRADATFGYRIDMTARANGRSVPVSAAAVAATAGHTELLLVTSAVRAPLPDRARLTALLTKMVTRARAAER
ncbi:MAG TPA: hypothetical protein VNA20_02900 [Frankiaceae bacterium]|nr:hypothetical protein [Frankiaceae bacterium]